MNRRASDALFGRIFHPGSIALVGASSRQNWQWLRSYLLGNFSGRLYPVNPNVESMLGFKFYPAPEAIPDRIDYAVILTPAATVPGIVEACGRKGAAAVQIFSSGFREAGTREGAALEEELLRTARRAGVRIIGPNCMGVYCPESGIAFRASFTARPGPVAVVSQSGGFAIGLVLWGQERGVGFSKVVNYGNGADLDGADFLGFLARDPKTKVIAAYAEGLKDEKRYLAALRRAASKKPVVVLKSGRTRAGSRAMARHTGREASSHSAWLRAVRSAGAFPADSFTDLAETMTAFSMLPRARGPRVSFVGMSGGDGVAASDAMESAGLKVSSLGRDLKRRFSKAAGKEIDNPVDLAAAYLDPKVLRATLTGLAADPGTDILVLEVPTRVLAPELYLEEEKGLFNALHRSLLAAKGRGKPVVVVTRSIEAEGRRWEFVRGLFEAGIPVFSEHGAAAKVMRRWVDYCLRR
ncbi:MAG: CoA-binding protein [Halobacteria archaeon]